MMGHKHRWVIGFVIDAFLDKCWSADLTRRGIKVVFYVCSNEPTFENFYSEFLEMENDDVICWVSQMMSHFLQNDDFIDYYSSAGQTL